MHSLLQDLRYAMRQMRRAPGFAITAVLTLALGVGANTAVFSLLDKALLRSLPVRDPKQLVLLRGTGDAWEGNTSMHGGGADAYFSYPMYRDLRDRTAEASPRLLEGLAAIDQSSVGVTWKNSASVASAEIVSGNYFDVLGVQPAMGRMLAQNDDLKKGAGNVAVLSFHYWRNHFGADPGVVGATIRVNGYPLQVVGVSAPGFAGAISGAPADLFFPMLMHTVVVPRPGSKSDRLDDHTSRWMNILGRVKPGVSIPQAQASLAPLWHALRAEELKALGQRDARFKEGFLTRSRLVLEPAGGGFSYNRESLATPLKTVMGMAALVLLIASINVASLLLVRSAGRMREFSLRFAVGASHSRIIRQLLLEGLLLGAMGGAAGVALAPFAIRVLVKQMASGDTLPYSTSLDERTLLFSFAVAMTVSLCFSLAPALQLLRPDLVNALKGKSATVSGGLVTLRRGIVCAQVGMSVLLLVVAGLFVRTMQRLRNVDTGFNANHLVMFSINPTFAGYAPDRIPALHHNLLEKFTAMPGVQSAGAIDSPEMANSGHGGNVTIPGYKAASEDDLEVFMYSITPDFLKTLQVPLLAGRFFNEGDTADHPKVIVVNEAFANRYFGSVPAAVGRFIGNGGGHNVALNLEIVGVAANYRHQNLRDAVGPSYFYPVAQNTRLSYLFYYIRTWTEPSQAFGMIRHAVSQTDASLVVDNMRSMQDQVDANLANERMVQMLSVGFGTLATLLAAIGLYGVLAYSTVQRMREIGIRMALGSSRIAVSQLVLKDVLLLAGAGVLPAIPCSMLLTRMLHKLLYGVSPYDPVTLVAVVAVMTLIAFAAALIPARRASQVDPTTALRAE